MKKIIIVSSLALIAATSFAQSRNPDKLRQTPNNFNAVCGTKILEIPAPIPLPLQRGKGLRATFDTAVKVGVSYLDDDTLSLKITIILYNSAGKEIQGGHFVYTCNGACYTGWLGNMSKNGIFTIVSDSALNGATFK